MRSMINTINYNVLRVWKEKQIWELDFETTSDSEDNDSDDDENDLRVKHFENIHKREMDLIRERKMDSKDRI